MLRAPRLLNPWAGLAGLPRGVWVIFATVLVNRAGMMVLPFLALYLTTDLGFPVEQAGLALSVYGCGALISAPLAGRLSDRFGAVRVMQWSLLLSGGLLVLLPVARSTTAVFALILIWAVVGEAVRPASLAALTDAAPSDLRKAAFALNRLGINLGMSIGPTLGGFLAVSSFPLLFVIDGITSAAAAALLFALGRNAMPSVDTGQGPGSPALSIFRAPLLFFLIGIFLCGVVFFQNEAAVPLFVVRDLRLSTSFFGLMFLVNTILIVVIEVPLNLAMSGWPHRTALAVGAALFAVGFGAMAVVDGALGVVATVVIWTFGEMIVFPAAASYLAEEAPADRRGLYMGAFSTALALAFVVGPWAGALVMERLGADTLWLVVLLTGLASAAIFATATKARRPHPEASQGV